MTDFCQWDSAKEPYNATGRLAVVGALNASLCCRQCEASTLQLRLLEAVPSSWLLPTDSPRLVARIVASATSHIAVICLTHRTDRTEHIEHRIFTQNDEPIELCVSFRRSCCQWLRSFWWQGPDSESL